MAELNFRFASVLEEEIIEMQDMEVNCGEYLLSRKSSNPLATKWPS